MKIRQTIFIVAAVVALGGYVAKQLNQDTLPKAANRLGQAILDNDTDTIWAFMPEDERAFYGFSQKQFAQYWNEIIEPELKNFDSFEMASANSNGLEVVLTSSSKQVHVQRAGWLVSGQLGKYYSPYMVAYSTLNAAGQDPKETRTADYVRFEKYGTWIAQHKERIKQLGITKIRRGALMQRGQTLEEMQTDFKNAVAHFKNQVNVASR